MAKRTYSQLVMVPKSFSSMEEINTGIAKMKRRTDEVKALDPNKISSSDQTVNNVESNIKEAIRIAYIPWDTGGPWKMALIKELKAAGYDVDANRAFG